METTPDTGNQPSSTPEEAREAREALEVAFRAERQAYAPRQVRSWDLVRVAVLVGAIWAAIGAGGLWRTLGYVFILGGFVGVVLWQRWKGNTPVVRARRAPRALRHAVLLPAAAAGAVAGIVLGAEELLLDSPYRWVVFGLVGMAVTLIAGLLGNWSYRRAYRRWLAERA